MERAVTSLNAFCGKLGPEGDLVPDLVELFGHKAPFQSHLHLLSRRGPLGRV